VRNSCGAGGNEPAEGIIELKAGDTVYGPFSPSLYTVYTLLADSLTQKEPSTGINGVAATRGLL